MVRLIKLMLNAETSMPFKPEQCIPICEQDANLNFEAYLRGDVPFEEAFDVVLRTGVMESGRTTHGWDLLASAATLDLQAFREENDHPVAQFAYSPGTTPRIKMLISAMKRRRGLRVMLPREAPETFGSYSITVDLQDSPASQRLLNEGRHYRLAPADLLPAEPRVHPRPESPNWHIDEVFSTLVSWIASREVAQSQIEQGELPPMPILKRYTSRLSYYELKQGLQKIGPEDLWYAYAEAQKLDPATVAAVSDKRLRRHTQKRKYTPINPILPPSVENGEAVPQSVAYRTWADVCAFYQRPLTHQVGGAVSMNGEHDTLDPSAWGTYFVPELMEQPDAQGRRLSNKSQWQLKQQFVCLAGIPKIERTALDDFAAQLPPGVSCLFITGKRNFRSFRTAEAIEPVESQLTQEEQLLVNLMMVKILRTGRSVGWKWLRKTTGFTSEQLDLHIFNLIGKLTDGSGALLRANDTDDSRHFNFADGTCIVDVRSTSKTDNRAPKTPSGSYVPQVYGAGQSPSRKRRR